MQHPHYQGKSGAESFLKIYFVFNYRYLCMSVQVSECECRCLKRAETLDSPRAGGTDSCELLNKGDLNS